MRRVAITGIGVVSPIGNNAGEFWDSLAAGRSGIGPITKVDTSELRFKNAAEVKGFDAGAHFDERAMMMLDPFAHFGIAAAREAISDSGVEFGDELKERTGVTTGSCLGGKETEDAFFYDLYANKKNRVPPIAIPRSMSNSVASERAAGSRGLASKTLSSSSFALPSSSCERKYSAAARRAGQ